MPNPPLPHLSSDLPTLCSRYDHGAGGLVGSSFVIYTVATLPPTLQLLSLTPPTTLATLASTVADRIPINLSIKGGLISLPSPALSTAGGREVDRLPWFFINAARYSKHTIAGRGSIVETLLTVLRRPWCVLELCCTPISTVQSLLAFAEYADGFDQAGYSAAVALFRHELTARAHPDLSLCRGALNPSRSVAALRSLCSAVFSTSLRSYNGFWLRLICVSAFWLGISYSRLGLLLNGGGCGKLPGGGVRRWRGLCFPFRRLGHVEAVRELDRGLEHRLRKVRSTVELERGKREENEGIPNTEMEPKEVLLWAYAQVLGRIGNDI